MGSLTKEVETRRKRRDGHKLKARQKAQQQRIAKDRVENKEARKAIGLGA